MTSTLEASKGVAACATDMFKLKKNGTMKKKINLLKVLSCCRVVVLSYFGIVIAHLSPLKV